LGSLASGWLDNWFVYHRLGKALARDRRIVRLLGTARAERMAAFVARNVSGVGGNVALGTLLRSVPSVPIAGAIVGLALDVRHVTFATGALVLGLASLGPTALADPRVHWALAGLTLVALMNFAVSFALALLVAMRARDVRHEWRVARAIFDRLRRQPREFVWPPREEPTLA
jgi:site-specific recombinase